MKNKQHIIFIIMLIIIHYNSPLNASTNTKDKIEKIQTARAAEKQEHEKSCWTCQHNRKAISHEFCSDLWDIGGKFNTQISELALQAEDLTDLEKLNLMYIDSFFHKRKEIITKMIQEGVHPDTIVYQYKATPMSEAILFRDDDFKQFLMKHGATKK